MLAVQSGGDGPSASLTFSPGFESRGRKYPEMQGLRPRATLAHSAYVEEPDASETQQIQVTVALWTELGEKVGLAALALVLCAPPVAGGTEATAGHLVLIGGGERPGYLMERIAELAGGGEGRWLVVPLANPEPDEAGPALQAALEQAGAGRVEVLSLAGPDADSWEARARVDQASGIFFAGGDQARLAAALRGTELLERIRELYSRGGVVAGTSAGATAIGAWMVTGASVPNQDPDRAVGTIRAGSVAVEPGLGLLEGVIVDQHFITRRRHNRLLTALLERPRLLAVGIDEATAVVVGPAGRFEVLGEGLVAVYDLSRAGAVAADRNGNLSATGIALHLLKSGQGFDLERRAPEPAGREDRVSPPAREP